MWLLFVKYELIRNAECSANPHNSYHVIANGRVCRAQMQPRRVAGSDEHVYRSTVAVVKEITPLSSTMLTQREEMEKRAHCEQHDQA